MLNITKTSKQTIERLGGDKGPVIVVTENTESRCFRPPRNQPPSAEEEKQRLLKIGFFHWLLNFILNNWYHSHSHKVPPTAKDIKDIVSHQCSSSTFDNWRDVIASIKKIHLTSLERALQIMWPFPLDDDSVELSSNQSLMTMSQNTFLHIPAENLLKLINGRSRLLKHEDMNTHIVRVMSMIGRDRHLTSEEALRPKQHVNVPGTNIVLASYELDDPTKYEAYAKIYKGLFGAGAAAKNTLVPPLYCLIHKALCRLNSAIQFFDGKCLGHMDMNSRNLQSAKLDLITYLEQVINLTRVSRTGEVITQGLSDVVFYLQLGAKGQVVNVPVPVAAFVPEILSLPGLASYVERTSKIKNMQEDVVHIHDMLPSVASALSMPHAIALVMRLIFLIDTEILDPRKNESMSLFVKRSNKEGVAFSNWTTTDSGVRPIQRNKKSIRTFDANTLGGDEALDDFSPYASRYLAARTFVRLKLVHESNKKKYGGGGASSSSSSSVLAIVPAANQPLGCCRGPVLWI